MKNSKNYLKFIDEAISANIFLQNQGRATKN